MHRLAGGAPDGAYGIDLLGRLGLAFVALHLGGTIDNGDLAKVPCGACLDERDLGRQTEAVDLPPGRDVVERVEDQGEPGQVLDVEPRPVAHVAVDGREVHLPARGGHRPPHLRGDGALGHADVVGPEEELPVEVRHVDGVQVHHVHAGEARQGQVLEQLAANAAGTDQEDAAGPDPLEEV